MIDPRAIYVQYNVGSNWGAMVAYLIFGAQNIE